MFFLWQELHSFKHTTFDLFHIIFRIGNNQKSSRCHDSIKKGDSGMLDFFLNTDLLPLSKVASK